jgi:hypothetical protein
VSFIIIIITRLPVGVWSMTPLISLFVCLFVRACVRALRKIKKNE